MKKLIQYFITYPIWANVFMVTILAAGWISLRNINTSFFPEAESNRISVSVSYPGASPKEIESSVVKPLEKSLRGIAGIERTTSTSRENTASIQVEAADNYDPKIIYEEVRSAVNRTSLPGATEPPVVRHNTFRARAVTIAAHGQEDLWTIMEEAQAFRDRLLDREGVSQVSLSGIPQREIAVLLSEEGLQRYDLTLSDVSDALGRANIDISGGSILTPREKIRIRAYGRRDRPEAIRDIPVKSDGTGTVVRIGDIARVQEQWEEEAGRTYYNGDRALLIRVEKTLDEDIIDVAGIVREEVAKASSRGGPVTLTVVSDATVSLSQRISILVRNGIIGFVLVLAVLGFFLNGRLSFWVAVGMPVSFAGMFIVALLTGITINVISLMGMIIVVGILVDDAIVVAESIYQKHEEGLPPFQAALEGTREVAVPVFTAVLTTVIAFLPFFFFQGRMGSVIYQLALVVIATLVFSLFESFCILPAHLAHSRGLTPQAAVTGLRRAFDRGYAFLKERIYAPLLQWAVTNKVLITALCAAYVAMTAALIGGKHVEFSAFPYTARDDATLSLVMPAGTRTGVTDSILNKLEAKIGRFNDSLRAERPDKKSVITSIYRSVGGHEGSLHLEFLPGKERDIPAFALQQQIRRNLGTPAGSKTLSFQAGRWGKAISLSLRSSSTQSLIAVRNKLKDQFSGYDELTDITDSEEDGGREIRLELTPTAHAVGISLQELAAQVRAAFFGHEVQRFLRGDNEIYLQVRYTNADRRSAGDLENMNIRTRDGKTYPLHTLARYSITRGRSAITHLDGRREIRVEADMKNPEASVNTMVQRLKAEVLPDLRAAHGDVQFSFEGRERHNRVFADSLKSSYTLALAAIILVLILVFRSPVQAGIIIVMIPLGMLGAVWGHFAHGFMISRFSIFGMIALAGVIVNDSIVFIDQINRNLKAGMPVAEAVFMAGQSRLRPILLTTLTTVAGMAPLIMETSRQARFLVPMAVSLSYGLLFSSLFILFLVPVLFLTINKLRRRAGSLRDPSVTAESVEPAVRELMAERESSL
ncbi:MAG: efflux RND transporter permease subunit [Fibrobacterota bacterium]